MSIIEALPADFVAAAAPAHGPAPAWRTRRHRLQGTALSPRHPVA
jgi:hypothetical protein